MARKSRAVPAEPAAEANIPDVHRAHEFTEQPGADGASHYVCARCGVDMDAPEAGGPCEPSAGG
jgi:hypothetical protein